MASRPWRATGARESPDACRRRQRAAPAAARRASLVATAGPGRRPSASRSCERSRGRAERNATRARMRSTSPTGAAGACSARNARRHRPAFPMACRRWRSDGSIATQRALQPAAQFASAHRGGRAVEHAEQRASLRPVEAAVEFEVAARGGIEQQRFIARLGADAAQVRQRRLLRVPHVLQQAARGAESHSEIGRRGRSRRGRACRTARSAAARRLPASKCQGGRSLRRDVALAAGARAAFSGSSSSAGRSRSSSAATASSPAR